MFVTFDVWSLKPPTMPAATVDHSQRICEVWACNLDEEMKKIRQVIRKYNYVAMDTEFPGVVARPIGEFRSNADYQYQLLRCNVDLLKIIQLGLTFMNEQGEYPPGTSTWQFNFKFNLTEDMYAQDSIELLTTSGIQFKKHEEEGIETQYFAELLMTSGVVLCEGVKWLSFHSNQKIVKLKSTKLLNQQVALYTCNGYDFGYLIKILTNSNLPEEELDFFEILRLFFPVIYDVKYLMKSCKNLKGGLQEVAEQLELERIGPQHQAGSDSLLTGMAFFKMREMFFEDHIDDAKYCGHLYARKQSSAKFSSFKLYFLVSVCCEVDLGEGKCTYRSPRLLVKSLQGEDDANGRRHANQIRNITLEIALIAVSLLSPSTTSTLLMLNTQFSQADYPYSKKTLPTPRLGETEKKEETGLVIYSPVSLHVMETLGYPAGPMGVQYTP
ncbi:hypothetical protein IHE44_0013049 [Lamprotornis superbus]|nr:hypothetical protein IHE44_0013049 [Lamprotornis superbus]